MTLKHYFLACFLAASVLVTSVPGASATFQMLVATAPAGGDITTGLSGWWKFDDGSGTSASDSSGNSNTGTLSGGTIPTWASPGQIGSSMLNFGGVGYVSVPYNASLNPTEITLSAWVRASSFPNSLNTIISSKSGSRSWQVFALSSGKLAVYFTTTGGLKYYSGSGVALSTSTWYFIAVTYDTTNGLICKVNDVVDGTASAGSALGQQASGSLSIGEDLSSTGRQWNGDIDDVRVYNRALTAADLTTLYAYR